jgi:tartrate dehydratase alpha subunit/fumarate hydratase class I-like protein
MVPLHLGGIERVFASAGKQHDALKKRTMDKTMESILKTEINTKLPTCDDTGVFTMMMTYTENTSSLRWTGGW